MAGDGIRAAGEAMAITVAEAGDGIAGGMAGDGMAGDGMAADGMAADGIVGAGTAGDGIAGKSRSRLFGRAQIMTFSTSLRSRPISSRRRS
jgi:hypothetical protein